MGMLLCLDRPHRLAYILGEILELDNREAANVRNRAGRLSTAPRALTSRNRELHNGKVWIGES